MDAPWHHQTVICPDPSTLQELVRELHQQATPWLPSGLGTRLNWTSPVLPRPGEAEPFVVSTRQLNTLIEHRPGDFTVTVQAGLPLLDLQTALAGTNQWLPIDWPWGSGIQGELSGSVGGLVARGLAGGLRQRHLGVRDHVIGIGVMRADGTIAKAGGQVVKNVAGYDLMRLFSGSWGSLGLITEVTLRTHPRPRLRSGLLMQGSVENLERLRQHCLNAPLPPQRLAWWSPALAEEEHPALLLTLASISTTAVAEQLHQLRGAADTYQVHVMQLEGEDLTLAESRGWGATNHGPAGPDTWLVHLGVLPANAKHLLKALAKLNLHCALAAGQGQGFAWRWERGLQADQVGLLRERCRALGGDLTILIQPTVTNLPLSSWSASSAQRWIQAIKREFDPLQQLARGRLPGR